MKSKKIFLLILFLLFTCKAIISQVNSKAKFVVITFELIKSNSKNKQVFYWITPVDSIENKLAFNIYPLYTEEYTKDNFDRCIKGDSVDVFTNTTNTNFEFGKNYETQVKQFVSMVNSKRVKVQTIALKWSKEIRDNETVNVYATPIIGEFCNCLQRHEIGGSHKLEFRALIYMPVSSFSFEENFWNTENGKVVKFADYSLVEFTSHLPSNWHGRSLCRAKSKVQIYE
jgi:hypothetical protein